MHWRPVLDAEADAVQAPARGRVRRDAVGDHEGKD
jgi:hypothetical protein